MFDPHALPIHWNTLCRSLRQSLPLYCRLAPAWTRELTSSCERFCDQPAPADASEFMSREEDYAGLLGKWNDLIGLAREVPVADRPRTASDLAAVG